MRTYSKIHVLTESDATYKKIYAEASAEDIEISCTSSFAPIENRLTEFDLIFADFDFLKNLKSIRERVVVISPNAYTRRLLKAGYTRFLFNKDDRNEILAAMVTVGNYRGGEEDEKKEAVIRDEKFEYLGVKMDFKKHVHYYKGKELYLTYAESNYLYVRFYLMDKKKAVKLRVNLCRMRKKFGSDFLKEK